jgi:hypothetical protein
MRSDRANQVAAKLAEGEECFRLIELLAELDGEDLDRVLQAVAMVRRRQLSAQEWSADLWRRAANPRNSGRRGALDNGSARQSGPSWAHQFASPRNARPR